ncbi:MAG: phosphate butyryltransferase [Lachnospiraceae bacterium]|nr:phosphate butyryltransferase [Lachnospiraceae bacterium]
MSRSFDELLSRVRDLEIKKLSVAVAQDASVMEAVELARREGIAAPILVGDRERIEEIADGLDIDLTKGYEILDKKDDEEAAAAAVKLVHDGDADMYMKGSLESKLFLKSVLDRDVGLRTGRPLSHVCVFEIPGIDRLLFLTDAAFIPYPTLEDKKVMIGYTAEIARACGVEMPKVAVLAAVETVNEKMPVTVEAAELTRLNEAGEIKGCIVDGPLSMDLAIDPSAAEYKPGAKDRKIVGDADILLFPDIHAGNLVYKTLVRTCNARNGNILTGTGSPVILTSRSDTVDVKFNSIAIAAVAAGSKGGLVP